MDAKEKKVIYLTFDMDWVGNELLDFFYDIICNLELCGTLHVTHYTTRLEDYRQDNKLELGIHPNFNKLLNIEEVGKSVETIIKEVMQIVPEAVTSRSHSLAITSYMCKMLAECGIKYESNIFYQPSDGIRIKCFTDMYGLVRVPFIFEDDIYLTYSKNRRAAISWYLSDAFEAPRIFNFHPIHLFLNTEDMDRYHQAIVHLKDYKMVKSYQNNMCYGIRDLFIDLVKTAKQEGYVFKMIKEISIDESGYTR